MYVVECFNVTLIVMMCLQYSLIPMQWTVQCLTKYLWTCFYTFVLEVKVRVVTCQREGSISGESQKAGKNHGNMENLETLNIALEVMRQQCMNPSFIHRSVLQ